eukprot:1181843-Prorocentrum_minimum.AAC.1
MPTARGNTNTYIEQIYLTSSEVNTSTNATRTCIDAICGRVHDMRGRVEGILQAPESAVGQPCGSLSTGNIRRIFGGTFETLCA